MQKYFDELKTACLMYKWLLLKMIFWGIIVMYLGWNFILKRPIYQKLYGIPSNEKLQIWNQDSFIEIPEQRIIPLQINGYDIEVQAIKSFKTVARIVYIDKYGTLGTWARSFDEARLYDKIVPQDISIATGAVGRDPSCIKFTHEYRVLSANRTNKPCSPEFLQNYVNEISNNHSIAASFNVQKGLDILKPGDVAAIEGYAIYWNGTGRLSHVRFESAITLGQISPQIIGGQHGILCRQLLITKITFDGYTFE